MLLSINHWSIILDSILQQNLFYSKHIFTTAIIKVHHIYVNMSPIIISLFACCGEQVIVIIISDPGVVTIDVGFQCVVDLTIKTTS